MVRVWRVAQAAVIAAAIITAWLVALPTSRATRSTDQIVFGTGADGDIRVINPDGTGETTIRPGAYYAAPAWSPDRTRIAFSSSRGGHLDIYTMNADGSGVTALTTSKDKDEASPSWSPDGTLLAFCGDNSFGGNTIWIMDLATRVRRQVSGSFLNCGGMSWSPDGRRLVYSVDYGGEFNLWIVNRDGSNLRGLTSTLDQDTRPDWSPDGSLIVFARLTGTSEIWTIHPDGTGATRLTQVGKESYLPAWSPDGSQIVYVYSDDLFVMNADGSEAHVITHGENDPWPDW